MARYGVRTKMSPEQVMKEAEAYFVTELGLEKKQSSPCCTTFEGGGGHVTVTVREGKDVEIETREWDDQVQRFMRKLAGGILSLLFEPQTVDPGTI
jgi:hypothetical protein